MSGSRRSSVDATFTQQNIGKFVKINKINKDKGVEEGDTRTGAEAVDHNRTSSTKQLGQPTTIAQKKCLRPASKSPEEVRASFEETKQKQHNVRTNNYNKEG